MARLQGLVKGLFVDDVAAFDDSQLAFHQDASQNMNHSSTRMPHVGHELPMPHKTLTRAFVFAPAFPRFIARVLPQMSAQARPTFTMTAPGGSSESSLSPMRPAVSGVSGKQINSILSRQTILGPPVLEVRTRVPVFLFLLL